MNCAEIREMVDSYAAGALTAEERATVEGHVSDCPGCRASLETAVEAVSALAMVLPPAAPPASLRDRVLRSATARAEPAPAPVLPGVSLSGKRASPRAWTRISISMPTAAAAAVLLLVFGALIWQNMVLTRLRSDVAELRTTVALQRGTIGALAGETKYFHLSAVAGAPPGAEGGVTIAHDRDPRRLLVVVVIGLPPVPEPGVYQVWLQHGDRRVSAGTFRVNQKGIGAVRYRSDRDLLTFKGLGITYEPAGPVVAPTGPRMLAGAFSD